MKILMYVGGALLLVAVVLFLLDSYGSGEGRLPRDGDDSTQSGEVTASGRVTMVNLNEIMVDGPVRVTLVTDGGEAILIAVPSMGLPTCAARASIADVNLIAVGDRVEVRGKRTESGDVVPCEDAAHYLRVEGIVEEGEAGLEFTYPKSPNGYVLEEGKAAMSIDSTFVRGYQLIHTDDVVGETDVPREGPPVIQVRTYRNLGNQGPEQWAMAHPLESNIELAMGSSSEVVVGGVKAVKYQADGLYASEVYVVTHGNYVHVFTAAYIDASSPQPADLRRILESIVFTPEQT